MSTPQNLAAWLDIPDTPFRIGPSDYPTPLPNELLIKVHAIAINPVEAMRQSHGFSNPTHPWIFGSDLAGTVEGVGKDVVGFEVGDRIAALSNEYMTHLSTDAAFQQYMKTPAVNAVKIPPSMPFTSATVFPLGLQTAAGMCFESVTLNCRFPMSTSTPSTFSPSPDAPNLPEVVTIWGGSSSVGCNAIQMLRAAGYRTIGLASPRNHQLMKECGADACFDYSDPNVVRQVCEFVKKEGWTSRGIVAAAGFLPPGPVAEDTRKRCGELAIGLGGHRFVSTCLARGLMEVPEMPEGVGASNVFGISEEKVREGVWVKWMEGALETGQLKALPPADVVGHGLEGIMTAIEMMKKGVSGKKLVVKIC